MKETDRISVLFPHFHRLFSYLSISKSIIETCTWNLMSESNMSLNMVHRCKTPTPNSWKSNALGRGRHNRCSISYRPLIQVPSLGDIKMKDTTIASQYFFSHFHQLFGYVCMLDLLTKNLHINYCQTPTSLTIS